MGMVAPQQRIASAYTVIFGCYGDVSRSAQVRGVSRQWASEALDRSPFTLHSLSSIFDRSVGNGEEFRVLGLIFILVVIWLALGVVFWAGSLWFQGQIYSEPAAGLAWRAPAAATAIALFTGLWCWLNLRGYDPRSPDELPYGNLLEFSPTEQRDVAQFTSIRKRKGQEKREELVYKSRKTASGGTEFYNDKNQKWKRSDPEGLMEVVVVDVDGQPVRLQAQLDKDGNFPQDEMAKYVEADGRGRYMTDNQPGRVTGFRTGLLVGNLLLNMGYLLVWFLCIWLLLRFQWSHALGLAVILWLAVTMLVLPMLGTQTKTVAQQRAAPPVQSLRWPGRHPDIDAASRGWPTAREPLPTTGDTHANTGVHS